MKYKIDHNAQFNSLEITFDSKPAEAVRAALKSLKFRWHSVKKCWYGYSTEEALRAALEAVEPCEAVAVELPEAKTINEGAIYEATERIIPGVFSKVPGGYAQQISDTTRYFVPEMSASSFNPETGELHGYAPDYEALEAAKKPAVVADKPGVYAYYYEADHAPTGCDFSADLSHDGEHYFLRPLHDSLPRLRGRGITYDEQYKVYKTTLRAYKKLQQEYKISYEMCFD